MALVQFAGLASGIDSASLIEAMLEQQRKASVTPLQERITEFEDQRETLSELKTMLTELNELVAQLRPVNGGAIAKEAFSSDETIATAMASNSAATGSYSLTINELASNSILSFDDRFTSGDSVIYAGLNDAAPVADRTVTFTIGTGTEQESVNVEMTSTMTANQFITNFNANSSSATASMVNVGTSGTPAYAIVVSSNDTGTEKGQVSVSVGSAISDSGTGAFTAYALEQAKDAEFSIAGITGIITRSSNTISDVMPGLTLTLENTGEANITIRSDAASTSAAVEDIVSKYNDIVGFIKEHDLVERQEDGEDARNVFGPLARTSLDENIITALRNAFSSATTSGGQISILAELGVTTERDGTLKFDSSIFEEALGTDLASVQTILERLGEGLGSTDGTLAQFTRFNGLIDSNLQESANQIKRFTEDIAKTEKQLANQEQALTQRFARLEKLMAEMQNQQSALTSLLPTS